MWETYAKFSLIPIMNNNVNQGGFTIVNRHCTVNAPTSDMFVASHKAKPFRVLNS